MWCVGRAFPEIQMCLQTLTGGSATPMAMADEKGNVTVINTVDNSWTERLARAVVVEMGGTALIGLYALGGDELKRSSVSGSLSLCSRIGLAVRSARERGNNPVQVLVDLVGGVRLSKARYLTLAAEPMAASLVQRSPSREAAPILVMSAASNPKTNTSSSSEKDA